MAYNRTIQHFTSSQELATIWASGQKYIVNQLVLDSDKLYRCNTAHTSGATFAGDSAYWTGLNQGGIVDINQGGTGQTTKTAAFDALAPTTTAGDLIVYNGTDNIRLPVGSDGQTIIADSSQTNKLKWATIPQGNKNYITYSNFENNATTGWSLFNTTLTGKIPTGSIVAGAASLNALAVSSSTPLAGSYSLSVTSPGAVAAGDGFITDVLTIDREDQAKVLTFSFYYEAVSGTMDFSGTSTNTWAIYIHDGTNWIQPAGVYGMTQSSGTGLVTGTFQTNATGTSYRLAVVCITATGAAISMKFDDFKLSPQTAPIGPVVTDWVNYTPTGGFTQNVTYTGRWRRVGDSMEVQFAMSFSGVTNSSSMTINLPIGYVVDSSKMTSVGLLDVMASGQIFRMGAGYLLGGYLASSTSIAMSYISNGSSSQETTATNFLPVALALGDTVNGSFRVPISGWSSNVQLSNDTDTRVVAFAAFAGSQNIANQAAEGSEPIFTAWSTAYLDTHAAWAGGGQYRIPVSGQYLVNVKIPKLTSTTNNYALILKLFKNSVGLDNRFARYDTPAVNQAVVTLQGSGIFTFNAGDLIDIRIFQNSGVTLSFGTESANLSIQRLSGPSVIAATENVIAKYSTTAGQAITTSPATVVYATREIDSHGIVNTTTGDITIPISGKYLIGVYGSTASAAFTSGGQFLWQIRKNGSFSSFVNQIRAQTAYTGILESVGPTYISCLAGDIINIQAQSSTATTLRTAAGTNFFYLVRLGN